MRHPPDSELPVTLDRAAATPLSEQLVVQVRTLVAGGVLRAGDPLPSTRTLARTLGIARGTVVTAWDVLAGEGYLVADRGATRIAPEVRIPAGATAHPRRAAPARTRVGAASSRSAPIDLRPGRAPITELDTAGWRRAWRAAASDVAHGDPTRTLPAHLSRYLRVNRGVLREADEIVVTAGARDGLQLVLRTLRQVRGRRLRVAVEDPGYPALRTVVAATGHEVLPIPVDEFGLDPAALPTGTWGGLGRWDVAAVPDAVVVTPGHQYPLGGTMPVNRRLDLVRWARVHDAVVIEDDYDSDLRDTGRPLPALAALDVERETVVTLGSLTKVLGSGVGLGHLVAPDALLDPVRELQRDLGAGVPAVARAALAGFMDAGDLQRHTSRMRRAYRRRRALIADLLDGIAGVRVLPMSGGAHAMVEVPDEDRAVAGAEERGVLVSGLAEYWATSRPGTVGRPRHGVVLGLTAADARLSAGVAALGDVLRRGPSR